MGIPVSHSVMDTVTTAAPVAAGSDGEPEFATITGTKKIVGLSRSTLYELHAEGEIQFVHIRKRGNQRGRVLVNLDSVRRFLDRCANGEVRKQVASAGGGRG